jgi:hypothetical protein
MYCKSKNGLWNGRELVMSKFTFWEKKTTPNFTDRAAPFSAQDTKARELCCCQFLSILKYHWVMSDDFECLLGMLAIQCTIGCTWSYWLVIPWHIRTARVVKSLTDFGACGPGLKAKSSACAAQPALVCDAAGCCSHPGTRVILRMFVFLFALWMLIGVRTLRLATCAIFFGDFGEISSTLQLLVAVGTCGPS